MTSKIMRSTSKKRKGSAKDDCRDRLSELPDEILVHILSFLHILDAVRTVLIRRFDNLWTLVPSLYFDDTDFLDGENWPYKDLCRDEQISCFVEFVFNVLMFHKKFPVDKFELGFHSIGVGHVDRETFDRNVKSWIRFAIGREVKELKVLFHQEAYDSVLPRCVFTSQFLVMLELSNGQIEQLSRVHMGSLRKLSLTDVELSNEAFKKLISGCPILQDLVLKDVFGMNELRFTAPSIENLYLDCDVCLIDCPNLKILSVCFHNGIESVQLVDVSSVREVNIRSSYHFDEIVKMFCDVEVIKFSDGDSEPSKLKELVLPQTRWKHLHLESLLTEDHFLGICRILRSSPHLEEFIIYTNSWCGSPQDKTRDSYMLSLELSSPCMMPQLKTVAIRGHKVPCQWMLRLAEFLLKNSVNMEKMVIIPGKNKLVATKKLKFVKQLQSIQKASTNARLIFGSQLY